MHPALYADHLTEPRSKQAAAMLTLPIQPLQPRHLGAATPCGGDHDVTRAQHWAVAMLLPAVLTTAGCNRRQGHGSKQDSPGQDALCAAGATMLDGVWWPGTITKSRLDGGPNARRLFGKARRLADPKAVGALDQALELIRLAAATGDLELAVLASEQARELAPDDHTARSFAAAALLARYFSRGATADLLDAAEILASRDGGDAAARCNRIRVYGQLGLRYRVRDRVTDCPCSCPTETEIAASSDLDGVRHSADSLPSGEFHRVVTLLDNAELQAARALVQKQSQAWRVYFEREALKQWLEATPEARATQVTSLLAIANIYQAATSNPVPGRLFTQLSRLAPGELATLERAIPLWLDGTLALTQFRPEEVVRKLSEARPLFEGAAPQMLPSIDLTLAGAKYHLGDAHGMKTEALAVRDKYSRHEAPWAWARALWLEAVALQGEADWEESLRRADEAGDLYLGLRERANAGYLDNVRAYAYESMQAEDEAQAAYLKAVRQTTAAGDSRLLAGALWLFSQHQGRVGRPNLAVELQRESTVLDSAEGAPQLVAEAKAILAEQLYRASRPEEARLVLAEAKAAAARIESARPRQRAMALLAQAEANGDADNAPALAEQALTRFLDNFESFGEKVKRAEALLRRARTRIAQGKITAGERDLTAALQEISSQSARLSDRVRAVALLDMARETLEQLVEVLLRQDDTGAKALAWVERLRDDQLLRGLGGNSTHVARSPRLIPAPDVCISEFFSLPHDLLSWTWCGDRPTVLRRTPVVREQLLEGLREFRSAGSEGDLDRLRQASASISSLLVSPQGDLLAGATSWVVIPDALFPAVPYAWLTVDKRFLFEDRSVATATSLSTLRARDHSRPPAWVIAAFGDPAQQAGDPYARPRLPYAAQEAADLGTRFPGAIVRIGTEATWSHFTASSERPATLLHFAGHVSGASKVPLGARMLFAPEPDRPTGRVAADEVARTPLRHVRLVVLAACASGSDAPARIAGSLDFSRAFLSAGADAVVATLWDVRDREISSVLTTFYTSLDDGLDPVDALRRTWSAQLSSNPSAATVSALTGLQMTSATVRSERTQP